MWWIRREACLCGGSASFRLTQKIKATTIALRVWNKEVFGNIQNCLKRLYDNIAHVQGLPPSEQSWEAELRLRADLLEMLHRDECLWKQKAKVTWLSTSDLNTHFFHLSTIILRRRKNIEAIKIGDGVWLQERADIGAHIVEHFPSLFASAGSRRSLNEVEALIQPILTKEDNSTVCGIPSKDEIKSAVVNLGALKAPGPDGMSALFFQHFWCTVEKDLVAMVQHFFRHGFLLKQLNHTFITLIPKVEHPSKIEQFCPISLCNVAYKVIAKLLAGRLRDVLPRLISPFQAAFVSGRTIQENAILGQEVLQSMKHKRGRKGWAALKLDMEKAYNRMKWRFLLKVLRCFRFSEVWVGWIEQCISTVSFSILLNG